MVWACDSEGEEGEDAQTKGGGKEIYLSLCGQADAMMRFALVQLGHQRTWLQDAALIASTARLIRGRGPTLRPI